MTAALCVCVLLVVLCTSCLGRPHSSHLQDERRPALLPSPEARLEAETPILSESHLRHTRSAPQPFPLSDEGEDTRANLSELLARLISSRKGSVRRNSTVNSKPSGLSSSHRIKDRDYLGWMDFGRRSAEEYEYSS
ncbi:cholecystokinin [Osmerus eperlanus]|uniref:cholecystokinin n=1 Tax=Osmerus eperlanus TaxID=29151 RepID=UPI002E153EB1